MKRIYFILIGLIIVFLNGCKDEQNDVIDDQSGEIKTRAFVSPILGQNSTSNPSLYSDWINVRPIKLNREGDVDPPWYVGFGNSMRIPDNIRTDVKKEDGWVMLGHTLERLNLAEPNYILFYNKKIGILKGFYYSDAAGQNQNVKWVLRATQASSLIPANGRVANLSNSAQEYGITSNIAIPSVVSSEAALNQGWNCFTFELPYGTVNQKPIISITGYSINNYELTATGTFSGQVIVPTMVSSNSLDGWKSFLNMTSSFTGAASTFANLFKKDTTKVKSSSSQISTRSLIATIGTINAAVSIASSLLGGASFFTSKQELVIQRYNFSGDIQLTGQVVGKFDGLIKSIDNIDLSLLNNNEALGVWGLNELPKIEIKKYAFVESFSLPVDDNSYNVYRDLNIKPTIKKESVVINPTLLPLIKNYNVTIGDVISTNSSDKKIRSLKYEQIQSDWYSANTDNGYLRLSRMVFPAGYLYPNGTQFIDYYMSFMDSFPEMYVSVLVEIEYNDGSILSSSRIFKVDGKIIDNKQDIINKSSKYSLPVFENYMLIGK